MAISEVTSQRNTNGGAASTSVTFTFPATPTEGNLMVVVFSFRVAGTTITGTPGVTWNKIGGTPANGNIAGCVCYWRVAGASEPTAHTWTLSASVKSAGCATEYSSTTGWTSPAGVTTNNSAATGTTDLSTGTTGTSGAGASAEILAVAAHACDTNATWSGHAGGSGATMTEILEVSSTGGPTSSRNTTSMSTGIRTTGNSTFECNADLSASNNWAAIIATFYEDAPPSADPLKRPNNAQAARARPELYCAAVFGVASIFSQSPAFIPPKADVSAVHYSVGSDRARVYSENRSWIKRTPTQLIPVAASITPKTRFAAPQFAEDPKSKLFKALILPPPDTIGAASYAAGSMAAEHATQQPRGFVRVTPPTLIPQVETGPNARTLVTLYQQQSDVQPQLVHPPIQYLAVVTKIAGTTVAPPPQTDQVAAGRAVVFKPSPEYLAVVTKTAGTLVAAPAQSDQSVSGSGRVSHPLVATTPPVDTIYRATLSASPQVFGNIQPELAKVPVQHLAVVEKTAGTLVVRPSQADQAASGSGFISKPLVFEPLSNVDAGYFAVGVDRAVVHSQNRSWIKNSPFVPAAPAVDEIYRTVRFAIPQSPELVAPQLFKTALAIPSDVIYRTTLFVAPQQQPSGYTTTLGRPALAPAAIAPDEIGASAYTAGSLAREHALTQLPAFVRGVNADLVPPPAAVDEIYRTTLFVAPPQIKTGSATVHSTHPDLVPPPAPVTVIFTRPLRVGPQLGDAGFAYLFDGSVVFSDPTVRPFIAAPQRPEHRAAVLLKSSDLIPPPPPLDVIYRLTKFSAPQQLAGGAAWILGTPEFVPPPSEVDAVHFSVGSDRVRLYSENRSWIKLGSPQLILPPAVPDVIFRSVRFTAPPQIPSGAGQILGKPVHVPALPIDTKISGTLTGGMRYEEFRRLQQPTFFDIPLEYYVPPAVVPPPVVPPPVVPPVQPAPVHPIRPAGRIVVTTKETGQIANARFDFISVIPKGDTITSAEVTAAVYSGVDPTPGAAIVALPEINHLIVTQKVQAPTVGVIYSLLCRVTTASGCVAEMSAYLTAMRKRGS